MTTCPACPACLARLAPGTPAHRYAVGRAAGHRDGHAMYWPPGDMPGAPGALCEAVPLWRPRKATPRRLVRAVVARRGDQIVAIRRADDPEPQGWPWDAAERIEHVKPKELTR